ncbi:HoxN/HupN/NixA family nickel/cobalt transporter [Huaxiibacter chinensis]|jgi:high-affinity nickel-transport protein
MLRRFRTHPRAAFLLLALVIANVLAWGLAWQTFSGNSALMAASLLAWCYGLRHAVDADHIAAIDSVTRKMMQQGKRPYGVGAWFSLGHSTIVVLATVAIAAAASAFQQKLSWFHDTGSLIGTAVSATFLLAMALVNALILQSVWRSFQRLKKGQSGIIEHDRAAQGGVMSWLFGNTFRLVNKSGQMYLVGFLFGLGFDTATEIGVLGISAASASNGMSVWAILIFPALFASGMALIDTLDNVLMVGAYGWAFDKPQRKLYYNMTITGTSVVVALLIGGLEAMGLLMDKFDLHGGIWNVVAAVNDRLGNAGYGVVGVFVVCWLISVANYRWRGYDTLVVREG